MRRQISYIVWQDDETRKEVKTLAAALKLYARFPKGKRGLSKLHHGANWSSLTPLLHDNNGLVIMTDKKNRSVIKQRHLARYNIG